MQLRRSILLAICIILFIYFEIHSCSKDEIAGPKPQPPPLDSVICAATSIFFLDADFGCVTGNLGTLMITRDGGETWGGVAVEGGTLTSAQFIDASMGWLVGKDGAIYRTSDGGSTWTGAAGSGYPADEDFYEIHFVDGMLGYILGYRGVYKTEDGGSTWKNNWLPITMYRGAWDMSFVDARTGFLLGSKYTDPDPIILYKTADGGANWSPVPGAKGSLLRTIITVEFVSAGTGWGGGGTIMKTTDGGMTWQTQLSSATVRKFFFLDAQLGFAVGGRAILRTVNGGARWENVTPADERINDLRGVFFIDRSNGWVVGRGPDETAGGKVYKHTILLRTRDGGSNWSLEDFRFDYSGVEITGTVD